MPQYQRQINDFTRASEQCDLSDLGFQGPMFMWCNRRTHPNTVWARLDRACGNVGWMARYPSTTVTHRPSPYSDHVVLILSWGSVSAQTGRKRMPQFCFEAKWLHPEECGVVVEEACSSESEPDPNSIYGVRFNRADLGCCSGIGNTLLGR
ncbi:UNVERIFIED_CONTAM: hypothetical protein Slati_0196500 [Sesamum latifolium]|uniref:Uncharacterized protein n=1 Tax=Sesamum latifolium TaxID=2727402 RepID=A0AAW2YBG1_9LAMI